jgi:hypothetical protein
MKYNKRKKRLEYPIYKRIVRFLYKWSWCSWQHRKSRCYPTVWGPKQAKEMGIPYRPNKWHCRRCHPCSEEFEKLLNG